MIRFLLVTLSNLRLREQYEKERNTKEFLLSALVAETGESLGLLWPLDTTKNNKCCGLGSLFKNLR